MTSYIGLRTSDGEVAAPPYTNGPYTWTLSTALADAKILNFVFTNSATSGDNRGVYNRFYLTGAGSGGESLRTYTSIQAACGTAHGIHASLDFSGDTTGELSGLGCAGRFTLHIPDDAAWASGTITAIQAELWADGAASDPDGVTELSMFRGVIGGNTTGDDDIETDAAFLSLSCTPATGAFVDSNITALTGKASLRVNVNGTLYGYIPIVSGS